MSGPGVIDLGPLGGGEAQRARLGRRLCQTLRRCGFCRLGGALPAALPAALLDGAAAFFSLPAADKDALHIRRSPHFRGYSEMRNARDFREQLHLGREEPALLGTGQACDRLRGPNLWPAALGAPFREAVLRYLEVAGGVGAAILGALSLALGLPEEALPASGGYWLLKLLCYHPQRGGGPLRMGVAPHCDWSWITLLLEDEVGGLALRGPDGRWRAAPAVPGTLLLNVGELLQVASGGRLRATPHRVLNRSRRSPRLSAPLFVNPPLHARVQPLLAPIPARDRGAHVHRVLPAMPTAPFLFGESEWRRKGLGRWCYREDCLL